ncbi:hypothetical protein HPP92_006231 [Vanilla planifolia]|uniref:Uncharacterized protein n=1 Tax=Vanilla planifolia TaxID=51239 RepID=A0A835S096_VANPL|nr:hypothetical protein HPP92_006519 [Vanilla planifolia]KAG0495237.1 hypothetical protein HPP92_006231 [Vanilla planifolia]
MWNRLAPYVLKLFGRHGQSPVKLRRQIFQVKEWRCAQSVSQNARLIDFPLFEWLVPSPSSHFLLNPIRLDYSSPPLPWIHSRKRRICDRGLTPESPLPQIGRKNKSPTTAISSHFNPPSSAIKPAAAPSPFDKSCEGVHSSTCFFAKGNRLEVPLSRQANPSQQLCFHPCTNGSVSILFLLRKLKNLRRNGPVPWWATASDEGPPMLTWLRQLEGCGSPGLDIFALHKGFFLFQFSASTSPS